MTRAEAIQKRFEVMLNERVKYTVATPKVVKRASAYGSSNGTKIEWIPDPKQYGVHDSNFDAKRAIVLLFHPELKDSGDAHIKRVSKEFFTGSMANYKVVKA
tara:strand:+ start:128954 stop:129259 length:306 start_codon:yes stop_codon:yes gene_type:complete